MAEPAANETDVEAEILHLLAQTVDEPARDALAPYLAHRLPQVRRIAVDVVIERLPSWGFEVLCLALLDASDQVRTTAVEGLQAVEDLLPDEPQLFDFLQQAMHGPDPAIRAGAVRLLRRTSDAGAVIFAAAATDPEPAVRIEAVQALAGLRAVREVCGLADDPHPEVRASVAGTIGRLADARGMEPLCRLAEDSEPGVRTAAVEAMPALGVADRIHDAVLRAARDASRTVRQAAAVALAEVPPTLAYPPLIALASDPSVEVRRAAIQTLGMSATASPDIRQALVEATQDDDAGVRTSARTALNRAMREIQPR